MVRARRFGVSLAMFVVALASCVGQRTGELEPRYVAVHNTLAALGLAQIGPIQQGSLAEGRETRLRVELSAQCTTLVAIGGPGVRDLDVSLLDPDDKPVAHDTTKEPQATLRACPTTAGHYTLVVKMAAGAGDFMAATWAGGNVGPTPAGSASANALATAGAGTCESPIPLSPGITLGTTRHGEAENSGSCASSDSKELVYRLEVTRKQRVTIEVDPQFDSILYVRKDDCADTEAEVACNDDATSGAGKRGTSSRGSRIDEVLEPGSYFVFVDGYQAESGTFKMTTQVADVPSLPDACRQVRPLGAAKVAGTLNGAFDHAHASCGGDAAGPDALYRFDVGSKARVRITEHSADFTPTMHVRKQCTDEHSEIACADSGVRADEATWTGLMEPGAYVLFADSKDKDARGHYTLETELAPESGTGVRGESCGDALTLGLDERAMEGDTFLARDDVAGKCGGQGAPDVVYRFELPRRSRITARITNEESAHVFVLTQSCTDHSSELRCGPFLDDVLDAGIYYLAIDGSSSDAFGRYTFSFLARDVSAQENACRAPPSLADGQTVSSTTAGAGDRFTTSCAGRQESQGSPDRVYRITLAAKARVRLSLGTPTWDGVLALRRECAEPARKSTTSKLSNEVACNNDSGDARHSKIETELEAGTYFVVVDGHRSGNEGAFTLEYRVLK